MMRKYVLLVLCATFNAIALSAQVYQQLRIAEVTHSTHESHTGVECRSITLQYNGSYSIELFNSNYNEPNDRAIFSFSWYLSYKGKRVSDYYKTSMSCRTTEKKIAWVWPDEVPKGNEKYVTVQFGKEPRAKDRRDDN